MENIHQALSFIPSYLRRQILEKGQLAEFPAGTELLREGQYVKVVPIVLNGLIKVSARFDKGELLLYYIKPVESCIMSFTAVIEEAPSRVFAVTEVPTEVILIPTLLVREWTQKYPAFNQLYFQQYHNRYNDLLSNIRHLLFDKLDQRLLHYLRQKAELKNTRVLHLHHREIATDLGTAREVITRLLKRLESEALVRQLENGKLEIL